MLVEICVEDAPGIQAAILGGADRVEVCTTLSVGGLTAGPDLIHYAIKAANTIPVQFLIRTRPGNFVYSQTEIQNMSAQIQHIKAQAEAAGVKENVGFVVGALTVSGEIDEHACAAFRQAAEEASLTFHRAFDATTNLGRSLETLITLGFDRVLTTGGHLSVANTAELLTLAKLSAGRIIILASGGLRANNVVHVVQASTAREVHMRAPYPDRPGTDPAQVRAILENLASAGLKTHTG